MKKTSLKQDPQKDFDKIYQMILEAQSTTWSAINTNLIQLYWNIGKYIFNKTKNSEWGKSTVEALAEYISRQHAAARGFSARNIWRMKQFFETYECHEKLSTLLTEISWSNHLHILSKTKTLE